MKITQKIKLILFYCFFCIFKNWSLYKKTLSGNVSQKKVDVVSTTAEDVVQICQQIYQVIQKLIVFVPLRSNCMQRALVVYKHLLNSGIASTFVVGVRVSPYSFHCWIEYNGEVVFDSPPQSQQYMTKIIKLNEFLDIKLSEI